MQTFIVIYVIGLFVIGWPLARLSLYLVCLESDINWRIGMKFLRNSLHPLSFILFGDVRKGNTIMSYEGSISRIFYTIDEVESGSKRRLYIILSSPFWPAKLSIWIIGIVFEIPRLIWILASRDREDD
jgi:hypothetical protein